MLHSQFCSHTLIQLTDKDYNTRLSAQTLSFHHTLHQWVLCIDTLSIAIDIYFNCTKVWMCQTRCFGLLYIMSLNTAVKEWTIVCKASCTMTETYGRSWMSPFYNNRFWNWPYLEVKQANLKWRYLWELRNIKHSLGNLMTVQMC